MTTILHLFTSRTCPHCPATKDFAKRFSTEQEIPLKEHNIQTQEGHEQAQYFGVQSVPTIIFFDEDIKQPIGLRGLPSDQGAIKALKAARNQSTKKTSLYTKVVQALK
jgi:glutaredoxin